MPIQRPWGLHLGGFAASLSLVACSPVAPPGVIGGSIALAPVEETRVAVGTDSLAPVATAPAGGPTSAPDQTTPTAAPPLGGTGGGGAPLPIVTLEGVVTALDDAAPVAGAQVTAQAVDGLVEATTDVEGRFSLTGRGLPQEVAVSAGGFVPRVTAGWAGPSARVRLRREAAVQPLVADAAALPLSGTVTDAAGAPVAGARVVGADGRGGSFGPVETDALGRFSGFASVPMDFAADGMALVAYTEAPAALASARRVPAASGAVGALVLSPAAGTVALTPGWVPGETRAAVMATVANGPAVALAAWRFGQPGGIEAPYFALAGVTLTAEAHAASDEAESGWTAPIDGPGTLAPMLLPQIDAPAAAPRRGASLAWPAVAGAEAYALTLRTPGAAAPRWEAVTTTPRVTLLATPDAATQLEIVALAGSTHRARRLLHLP